jgi:hypothetical protein
VFWEAVFSKILPLLQNGAFLDAFLNKPDAPIARDDPGQSDSE